MAPSYDQQLISCEIMIRQAKNVEEFMTVNSHYYKPTGKLFVRYYLSAGNNKRIQLNTKEISTSASTSYDHLISWNESSSLDCVGTQDSIRSLKKSRVVFELRWRPFSSSRQNNYNMFGLASGSKLVGRAELPWESVVESPGMEVEKWVVMNPIKKGSHVSCDGVKPPSVKIGMRVRIPSSMEMTSNKNTGSDNKYLRNNVDYSECGCCRHSGCNFCEHYDVYALVAAFDSL